MNIQHSTFNAQHSMAGYINLPIRDDSSGMDEIERREVEEALREWQGFWQGLLIALAFGVTAMLVIWAIVF
jgi:hypothetical protein